jgi:segregation and condensation protein B
MNGPGAAASFVLFAHFNVQAFSNVQGHKSLIRLMELSELIPHIEALIFASDKPLSGTEITELINGAFGFMEDKITEEQVETALSGISEKYDSEFYPFSIRQSGGGWQFLTKKDFHKTIAQLNGEKYLKRLSPAALETLAIIAYKQPITKGEIELIRGVSADYTIQKLLEKELIVIAGRNENAVGHPLVYATSKTFMDYFGLNTTADLPKIREVLQEMVTPTTVNGAVVEPSDVLAVSDDGELVARMEEPPIEGARLFVNGYPVDTDGTDEADLHADKEDEERAPVERRDPDSEEQDPEQQA